MCKDTHLQKPPACDIILATDISNRFETSIFSLFLTLPNLLCSNKAFVLVGGYKQRARAIYTFLESKKVVKIICLEWLLPLGPGMKNDAILKIDVIWDL